MDAFGVLRKVLDDYQSFVTGFLEIKDDQNRAKAESEITDRLLWPEHWLALNGPFESGRTSGDLVKQEFLHPEAKNILRVPKRRESNGPADQLPPPPDRRRQRRNRLATIGGRSCRPGILPYSSDRE